MLLICSDVEMEPAMVLNNVTYELAQPVMIPITDVQVLVRYRHLFVTFMLARQAEQLLCL